MIYGESYAPVAAEAVKAVVCGERSDQRVRIFLFLHDKQDPSLIAVAIGCGARIPGIHAVLAHERSRRRPLH